MPQLDFATFPSQFFWFLLTYLVLILSITKYIIPKIHNALQARKKYIADLHNDIASAKAKIIEIEEECNQILQKTKNDLANEMQIQIEQMNLLVNSKKKEVDVQVKEMQVASEEKMRTLTTNLSREMQSTIRSSVRLGVHKLLDYEIDEDLLDQYIKMG